MKQLAIISGKGGTGKTTVAASLAALLSSKTVLADCDVDASNLPLVLRAKVEKQTPFQAGKTAEIDQDRCNQSGRCFEECRFDAILKVDHQYQINPLNCEGCSVCAFVCPSNAISMKPLECGDLYQSQTAYGPLIHASLHPGRENSGKLVTYVRDTALEKAKEIDADIILIDGSPGIGCPVIASLTGVDLALIVTEPTPTGLQGMERVMQVAHHFGVPCILCINKRELNPELVDEIQKVGTQHQSEVVGTLPFDRAVVEANSRLIPIVEMESSEVTEALKKLSIEILNRLEL